jgi:hypothetical protein
VLCIVSFQQNLSFVWGFLTTQEETTQSTTNDYDLCGIPSSLTRAKEMALPFPERLWRNVEVVTALHVSSSQTFPHSGRGEDTKWSSFSENELGDHPHQAHFHLAQCSTSNRSFLRPLLYLHIVTTNSTVSYYLL